MRELELTELDEVAGGSMHGGGGRYWTSLDGEASGAGNTSAYDSCAAGSAFIGDIGGIAGAMIGAGGAALACGTSGPGAAACITGAGVLGQQMGESLGDGFVNDACQGFADGEFNGNGLNSGDPADYGFDNDGCDTGCPW